MTYDEITEFYNKKVAELKIEEEKFNSFVEKNIAYRRHT